MFPARLFDWASRWVWRQNIPLRQLHFLMYTRQGCHLCEAAWRQLQTAQRRHHFTLEEVDVDSDPELATRYTDRVPVVMVNGKLRFSGAINPVLLDRLLHAELG
jgi:glutaredoxin